MCLLCRSIALLTSLYVCLQGNNQCGSVLVLVQILVLSVLVCHICLPIAVYILGFWARFSLATTLYGYLSMQVALLRVSSVHKQSSWRIIQMFSSLVWIMKSALVTAIICCYQLWRMIIKNVHVSPTSAVRLSVYVLITVWNESGVVKVLQLLSQRRVFSILQVCHIIILFIMNILSEISSMDIYVQSEDQLFGCVTYLTTTYVSMGLPNKWQGRLTVRYSTIFYFLLLFKSL
jgi:hypothetical protein